MIAHFFIGFFMLLFISLVIYSLLSIIFKLQFPWASNLSTAIQKHNLTPLVILLLLGFIYLLVFGLTKSNSYNSFVETISPKSSGLGGIGDLVNGLITPIISVITIIYLYKAFVQQYLANQILFNSEIEKSFKEDLHWLRSNTEISRNLSSEIDGKDNDELTIYLDPSNDYQIRKTIYILNVFLQTYENLKKHNNLQHIKNDTINILTSLYLPSLSSIYRNLSDYVLNMIAGDEDFSLNFTKAEIEFLDKFTTLYLQTPIQNENRLFTIKVQSFNDILKQQ